MSRIDELIEEFCPDGVPYKELGEIGSFYSGLTGKSKSDFQDGNAKFVTYMNVFSNIAVNTDISDYVKIKGGEKQNQLRQSDILFTGSSETPDECGMSSVLTKQTSNDLYLNSFCFGFRLNDEDLLLPNFSKYLFRSDSIRKQIIRTASGVTRFNVSKQKMLKVRIPIPPLPVQEEIARILDTFTELETELESELEARKKQYEYYRDKLLTLDKPTGFKRIDQLMAKVCPGEISFRRFGEIATIVRGASPRPINQFITTDLNGINWIKIGDISPGSKYVTSTAEKITIEGAQKSRFVRRGDFILSNSMSFGRPYILKCDGCIHDGWLAISDFNRTFLPDFLFHLLNSNEYQRQMKQKASFGGAVQNLNADIVKNLLLPTPPLPVQEEIVWILDRFDTLCNDQTSGLPAEIEARRKQYEYYRDKLLTFKELKA